MRGKSHFISQCPLCSHKYQKDSVRILEQEGDARLMHMTCGKCKNAVLALVVTSKAVVGSVGMMTDLTVKDVVRLREKEAVTEEELLEFHTLLKQQPQQWLQHIQS
ncbi:MAG: hypothetical protein A3J66_00395 [Candidatus Magasanikbacteria bacterium RIFCSPHIGHO2_02_FULL_47_14]|uniref:Uncharacterized protein n=1 Tax=Candidatus Magasanikbacteria bacterium RIFCSPHIGHO2_02_FULL_47_14 TaxID=1798680 RepID=A0A1F6MA72_9BACT|nr:MAG: hypothetical protein A3J66_00395 [Candidatus Magasanikbacteria bacterium RIFCSPHIGHO2_02_FULL_47_14]